MTASRRLTCVALFLAACLPRPASAQPAAAPPPEAVSLQTKDGVQLKLTYYPSAWRGTAKAKQVTPVVLLHDYKDTRASLARLAQRLQAPAEDELERPSFAVVTVDLRAHGESTKAVLPSGEPIELDAARLDKQGLLAMASFDMEVVRGFLVAKNDAGELNLNKLSLLGAGMGANVATNWALQDWAAPALAVGKQGQDVKALVLISPTWSYKGLSLQAPMRFRPLMQNVAWLLIYGDEDSKARAEGRRVAKQLERYHPEREEGAAARPRGLEVVAWPSKLQGDTLLTRIGAPIEDQVVQFLVEHVANQEHPWLSRLDRLP